jgi:hypothetical protein
MMQYRMCEERSGVLIVFIHSEYQAQEKDIRVFIPDAGFHAAI